MVSGKMIPEKNGARKNGPREKWSPEKFPPKIVRRQKNARKFKRVFIFINWFHYTHKKMFDAYVTILHMYQTVEH